MPITAFLFPGAHYPQQETVPMSFKEIPPQSGQPSTMPPHLCNGHCACSGYGTRANCPPLIILATSLIEDPLAAACFLMAPSTPSQL
jgi:hypothetical protein